MATDALIRARNLTKRFGALTAVDGIDFDVARGEAFGFLGPNGAGKTSAMRMIGCVSPPTSGELRILGLDPAADGPSIRGRLGVVPQQDNLDQDLKVRENILIYGRYFGLPRATVAERADELLEFAQLTDRAESLVEPLSGGMKRRLTIARALVTEPALLLADDGSLTDRGRTIIEQTPMARFGDPEDLLGALLWLASDASRFVTGVVVPVDGGFSAFSGV